MTTHGKDEHLITIEEISGILDHSAACNNVQEMDQDPSIKLHPELRAYALSLLRDSHANLLILMAPDKNQKGIPIAFIVFTAKPEAKAVHSDYNGKLLNFLLEKWRAGLGRNPAGTSAFAEFDTLNISIATTDNDTRE
ncbi:hypothetical protein C0992_000236 [Termitomyces sp. T32_za158]|nr:hypothetical protein C0992_000236 [Termitomyces sp. T32_za158]